MKNLIVTTVGAAAIVAAGMYFLQQSPQPPALNQSNLEARVAALEEKVSVMRKNPTSTTIVLSKAGDECDTAKVSDYRVGNLHERNVFWHIVDDCALFPGWRLELRFTPKGGKVPFAGGKLTSRATPRGVQGKILPRAAVDPDVFEYRIYLIRGGQEKLMADPELEVEPPPVRGNQ